MSPSYLFGYDDDSSKPHSRSTSTLNKVRY
jgi:hypothetical protein